MSKATNLPPIVSPAEWQAAHEQLLAKEKSATRARDALAAHRRRQPMVRIDKDYFFEGPSGRARLLDLFEGRRQLMLYHFMFRPGAHGWPDAGCDGCSMFVDQVGHLAHLHARDTSFTLVSIAPISSIERYRTRMGWTIRTYFTSGRGVEALGSVWTFLDLTPLGRQEEWEDSPEGWPQSAPYLWWRRHDEYEAQTDSSTCCR